MKQPVYARGTIVDGKYRIDKAIARGGCSIVYRGTHIQMERSVALKIMSSAGGGPLDEAWTQRFQREARLASQLRHPNTIIIYDYGNDQGLWYIAMEWVEGASLRNAIKDHGPIEAMRVATLTVQMLKSLREAHRNKILHRDLKPSNIMLTEDSDGEEQVKVLDFGLAKTDPNEWANQLKLTRDGDFVGTPRYAPPEQLKGRELSAASDIYGVGMVMWEMLTGAPAVPGVDYGMCVEYHLGPNPWKLPPGLVPPGLASIVEHALLKEMDARFQTCEEMTEALEAWIARQNGIQISVPRDSEVLLGGGDDFLLDEAAPMELSGPSSAAEVEEPPSRRNTTPRPNRATRQPGRSEHRSIAELSSHELELDLARKKKIGSGRRPSMSVHHPVERVPVDYGAPSSPIDRDVVSKIVVALVVLAAIAGGVYLMMSQPDAPEAVDETDPFIEGLKAKQRGEKGQGEREPPSGAQLRAMMDTRDIEDLMVLMRTNGWSFAQDPSTTELGGVKQATLRVRKSRATVDLTIYQVDTVDLARDLEMQTERPAEAVRFGLTVVRMTPVGVFGEGGVGQLRRSFLEVKGVLRE